jgi:hypothetical protein
MSISYCICGASCCDTMVAEYATVATAVIAHFAGLSCRQHDATAMHAMQTCALHTDYGRCDDELVFVTTEKAL